MLSKKSHSWSPVLVLLALVILSCTDKQDFNQLDDLDITPTMEAPMVFLETPERVINEVPGNMFYTQDFNFDAFSESYVSERILDGVITYEVENTTSKQIDFSISFLDAAGNVLDTENFMIDPAPTAILYREIAYGGATGRSIDIIRNTSGIRVSGQNLGDNTSVSALPDPKIVLRSSAQIRLRVK